MMTLLATREVRRAPSLLLVATLLLMGVVVARAPVLDASSDGMSAYGSTHAQVVRAPLLRGVTAPTGHAPVAALVAGSLLPAERVVQEADEHGAPLVTPRSAPRPSHSPRAPPASL